ncbi:MAG: LysE family transporter [Pseudomonadota bacterium]|nr:LysE family transporter [Pseudomonadota bacterium]
MSALWLGFAAFAVASASPGPTTLAIMATGLGHGRRAALGLAAGVVAGSCTLGALAAGGLAAVLASAAWALIALKIAGALYLARLAWKMARSAATPDAPEGSPPALAPRPLGAWMRRGLAMHVANPKPIFGWAAIITVGLPAEAGPGDAFVLLAGCAAMAVAINFGYALIFSTAPLMRAHARARRRIDAVFATLFAAAAAALAWRAGGDLVRALRAPAAAAAP